jgi:sugar phosphate isomerase/epimerase
MYRRSFLQAGVATGLAWGAGLVTTPSTPAAASTAKTLTLGFSTYGTKSLKTEAAIDLVSATGFDSIELTIWPDWDADPAVMKPARRRALRKRLADRGLRVTSLMEHLHIDDPKRTRAQRLQRIKLAAALAHDLNPVHPPLLQTTIGGGGKWAQKRDGYLQEITEWLKVADAEDLVIAVKPHRGGAFSRPREAAELIKRLGSPRRLRMCYDYSHYDFRDMTLEGTLKTSLPFVGHIAVKDVVRRDKKLRFVLPGQGGRIDYARLIGGFHAGGYRGDICVEISGQVWSQPGYDPVVAARSCYQHLAGAFARSGVPRPK